MTDLSQLAGWQDVAKALDLYTSPRAKRLAALERWVAGTQYTGQPSFFSDEAPYHDRAPCIVYPVVQSAIASFTDLVMGEGRWPEFCLGSSDEDGPLDDEGAYSDDEKSTLRQFVVECVRQSRFQRVAREALAAAMGSCSAVVLFGVRNGSLFANTTRARWCEPELDDDGNVTRLVIEYPYPEQYQERGQWKVRARLYRRVIDAERDVTCKPADIRGDAYVEPRWVEDQTRTIEHDLGFCPVVWYPFLRGCSVEGEKDGHAIHETLLDELRALDFALSQRHRAALYAGDPQWTETGVERGYCPTDAIPVPDAPASPTGGPMTMGHQPTAHYVDPRQQTKQGRRKSPSTIWQYEDPATKVQLHTLPGDALKGLTEHAEDLRNKIAEALSVVFLDPASVKFAASLSGKALEALRARQLDRCDQIRDDIGDGLLIPGVNMLLRIAAAVGQRGGLRVPGLKQALPLLRQQGADDAVAAA